MSKKTLEYISNNIITSELLVEKINEKSEETTQKFDVSKIKSKPMFQDLALTNYFKNYLEYPKDVKFTRRAITKPLPPMRHTFIYNGYEFLTSPVDKQLLVRSSINRQNETAQSNLVDTINHVINDGSKKLNIDEVLDEFVPTELLTLEDFRSYIEAEIPRAKYKVVGSKNIINQETIQRTHRFLDRFVKIVSNILDINVMFILPSVVSKDNTSNKSLILSDLLEERPTLGLVVFIPSIHPITVYKDIKIPDNTIFFDNLIQLDFNNNSTQSLIGRKITKNIIIENGLTLSNKLFRNPVEKNSSITFEPLDRYQDLPVVQILGPDNVSRNYLLGIFGNLYEDDDKFNDLVGKVQFLDSSNGQGKIFWCEDYYNNLKN